MFAFLSAFGNADITAPSDVDRALLVLTEKYPDFVSEVQSQYGDYLSNRRRINPKEKGNYFLVQKAFEMGKIIGMGTLASIFYGIIHDLITTHIDFRYFAALPEHGEPFNHHGCVTKNYYPWVYHSHSKILYALLWGTIATWWVGLQLGGVLAVTSSLGEAPPMAAKDLYQPISVFLILNLGIAILSGANTYFSTKDTFKTVASIHNSSYSIGILGGLLFNGYVVHKRYQLSQNILKQRKGFAQSVSLLFIKNPQDQDIQNLVRIL